MLFLVIEHFRDGKPRPVYERFQERGRLAPDGLRYVNSWVTDDLATCYQVMECNDRALLDQWIANWKDLVDFEVFPVLTSAEAAARVLERTVAPAPKQSLARVTLVVRDYDEAMAYYTKTLGFTLIEDTRLSTEKRWVAVAPPGGGAQLLLARAANDAQAAAVGNQAGGRVGFFLTTDDFDRDYAAFSARGVRFIEKPRQESYGKVAVFEDLYGNRWDLVERI